MENKNASVFSKALKAGRKRTYFFDVKTTKSNDYFLTITESRRKPNGDGYEKNKIFLYKEDFNKFIASMQETIDHVKNELMPDYDFTSFDREHEDEYRSNNSPSFYANEKSSHNIGDDGDEKLHSGKPSSDDFGHSSSILGDGDEKW